MNQESPEFHAPNRGWRRRFQDAFRGVALGIHDQPCFYVHLGMAALVVAAALVLGVSQVQWCLLVLCITIVLAAEMFNTALEHLAKAVDRSHNVHLGNALDIGSAAVLLAAAGAAIVGGAILGQRLLACWSGLSSAQIP